MRWLGEDRKLWGELSIYLNNVELITISYIIFNDNKYWYPDLYVNFHVFPNSNGKYFIYASPSSGASNGGVYLIYYDQSWYVTKNKAFRESDFLNVDSIKNAVSNTDQWLKIE